MKKAISRFSVVVGIIAVLFFSVSSFAATFKTEVHVMANDAGVVTIVGGEEIVKLIQYCPDEWVDGCDSNIIIKRVNHSFVLDKEGLAHHQNAFNFRDSSGKWLLIPDKARVTAGANVKIETKSKKSYFIYTGASGKDQGGD